MKNNRIPRVGDIIKIGFGASNFQRRDIPEEQKEMYLVIKVRMYGFTGCEIDLINNKNYCQKVFVDWEKIGFHYWELV